MLHKLWHARGGLLIPAWYRAETHLRVFGLSVSCCKHAWIIHHILCLSSAHIRHSFDSALIRVEKDLEIFTITLCLISFPFLPLLLHLYLVYILSPQTPRFTSQPALNLFYWKNKKIHLGLLDLVLEHDSWLQAANLHACNVNFVNFV